MPARQVATTDEVGMEPSLVDKWTFQDPPARSAVRLQYALWAGCLHFACRIGRKNSLIWECERVWFKQRKGHPVQWSRLILCASQCVLFSGNTEPRAGIWAQLEGAQLFCAALLELLFWIARLPKGRLSPFFAYPLLRSASRGGSTDFT